MYTANEAEALKKRLEEQGMSKAEIVKAMAFYCSGWPYVFGAWGAKCTPANRRTYEDRCKAKHPDYAEKIIKACPVLSEKQSTCAGCKWENTLCFDCRGYTNWLLKQVGL